MELNDKEHQLLIKALNYATNQLSLAEISDLLKKRNLLALLELKEKLLDVEVKP